MGEVEPLFEPRMHLFVITRDNETHDWSVEKKPAKEIDLSLFVQDHYFAFTVHYPKQTV